MQQKRFISFLLLIIAVQGLNAEYFNPVTDRARHYVGLSLSGAEANNLKQNTVLMNAGVSAALDFHYEVAYHHFLFDVGLGAQYQCLNDGIAEFSDVFTRADREGEYYDYAYNYKSYAQRSTMINVELPISLGYNFAIYGYFLVGAKMTFPVKASYSTQTDMATSGYYPWAVEAFNSSPTTNLVSYGIFPENHYSQQSGYKEPLRVSVNAEIGGLLPFENMGGHRLRLGAYVDFGFRTGSYQPLTVVDYSAVDKVPFITDQQQLASLIRFNSLPFTDKYSHLPYTLEVGLRLTWLVDVTIAKEKCLLCEQVKKQKRAQRQYFQ